MHPEFFFYRVAMNDHQRVFEDEEDFVTFIHTMKWKTMWETREYERGLQAD